MKLKDFLELNIVGNGTETPVFYKLAIGGWEDEDKETEYLSLHRKGYNTFEEDKELEQYLDMEIYSVEIDTNNIDVNEIHVTIEI